MSPPRSRTIWAEDRLRHAIVSGELAPGERVLIEPLAQAWDLSATPLREALRTLAGEGLVVLDAQRGARIAPVSEQELTEVYELRLIVEPLAFRLSVLASDEAWLDRLDVAWAALQTAHAARPSSPLDLEPAHTEFHFALVANCGSDALLRLVSVLATQALRFRTLAAHARPGGNRRSLAEHRRLHDLARRGEADDGAQLLAEHLSWPLIAFGGGVLERVAERLAALDPSLAVAGLESLAVRSGSRGRSPA